MLPKFFMTKFIFFIIATAMLAHCTQLPEGINSGLNRSERSPYSRSAAAYLALANTQIGSEQQNTLLMAAGAYLHNGQWQEAATILAQTNPLSVLQADEKNILLAQLDLLREQPRAAITRLSTVHEQANLPQFYRAHYYEILATSYEAIGNPTYAINERIKLKPLLLDEVSRTHNHRLIWLILTKLPSAELNTMGLEAKEGSELQGWVKLALISRHEKGQPQLTLAQVEQWQRQFPYHSANGLLSSSLSTKRPYLQGSPHNMALLLPTSGPLAGPGNAIRDGFMTAYHDEGTQGINVRVYNTQTANVVDLYQQAINEGAEYVVGPLTKMDVAAVAKINHPVPTILLNDLEVMPSANAYRFGLSPTNEARQVARKASKKGLRRALIIAPVGSWGNEIVASFSSQWRSNGGVIVERLDFDNQTNLNEAVRDFLHVSEQQAREKQFRPGAISAGAKIAKRRQDFDMIFLLAYPSKARQIMPLLRYYFAGDIPVYATSAVYGGSTNTMRDRDLDGIIFCDMPAVFNSHLSAKNWPEQLNSYSRLYALGYDSYHLATQLNQLILFPALGVNDKSGVLYLNQGQQINRMLAWGKFKAGIAQLINE